MKITVTKKNLSIAVRELRRAADARSSIEALGRVLAEVRDGRLVLRATNGDMAAVAAVPGEADAGDGENLVAFPLDILERATKAKCGEITVSAEPGEDGISTVEIRAGRSKLRTDGPMARPFSSEVEEVLAHDESDDDPAEIAEWRSALLHYLRWFGAAPGQPKDESKVLDSVTFYNPKSLLVSVTEAMSSEETRYYLNGVYFDATKPGQGLTVVAADGHRLVTWPCGIVDNFGEGDGHGYIASGDVLHALKAGAGARSDALSLAFRKISFVPNPHAAKAEHRVVEASYSLGGIDFRLTGKVIDASYPEWRRVIPEEKDAKTVVSVPFDGFMETVREVLALSGSRGRHARTAAALNLSLKDKTFTISIENGGAEVEGSFPRPSDAARGGSADKSIEIGFNIQYLAKIPDMLGEVGDLEGRNLVLRFVDSGSPGVFHVDGDDVRLILMPMRIK